MIKSLGEKHPDTKKASFIAPDSAILGDVTGNEVTFEDGGGLRVGTEDGSHALRECALGSAGLKSGAGPELGHHFERLRDRLICPRDLVIGQLVVEVRARGAQVNVLEPIGQRPTNIGAH